MARMGSTATRRRRVPAKSRRDQLLDEAARQLNARGVSLTSLTDVADQLGVSRAALYYYVDDREDLVFQVYRRSCEILARHLGEAARSGRKALDVVAAFVSTTIDPDEAEIAALSEIGLLRPAERETVLALYEGVVARLASVLEAGARAGEVRPCDFEIAARSIISMIYWAPLAGRWTMTADATKRRDLIAMTIDIVTRGTATDRTKVIDPPRIDLTPLLSPRIAAFDRDALSEARRETILLTASRLFNAKGVDTTSLDEIASELGATKRTLYHYVGDKQALISACYERAYRIYFYAQDRADEMGLSAQEAAVAAARAGSEAQQRRDISPLRPLVGFEALGAEERLAAEGRSRQLSAQSRARFVREQADGDVRPELDPDQIQLILPGPGVWLAKDFIISTEPRQIQIADEIAEMLRIGLAPIPG